MKPYTLIDPYGYALLTSARRYRRIVGRHTTKALLEHPLNEHEYLRATRVGAMHAAFFVVLGFSFTFARGWLIFSWDASKALVTAAWQKQPAQAQATVEATLVIAGTLTLLTLVVDGWGLFHGFKAFVLYALFTLPLVFAVVMRRQIQWVNLLRERHRDDGDVEATPPLLTLGEAASPPGLEKAGKGRGGEDGA